ncbi:hypothetical protein AK88_01065 [Plasmodium fragile]|uniref:2-C-methyl-D-erythritol 4-phosphate cytidylyltransferase n=1 Tax=Plasmodium fragile TaxID=5857 RepID=A0A0D9QQY6_PLAFR|nr:uncharacterized protein AK88_01065 [Plasmodium fragile]KJP89187.1 hypothetical protein AK88_01065 [Plasmodium fragile]
MKDAMLSVRLMTCLFTRFSLWCVLINYLLTLPGCLPHVLHRKHAPTCSKVRRVHRVRIFHHQPWGEVSSSLNDLKGDVPVCATQRGNVNALQFIVTKWTGTKRGGAHRVRFFTPARVEVNLFEEGKKKSEYDRRGQLHAAEEGENAHTAEKKHNPQLLETATKIDHHDTKEYRSYEQSLKKKNIHAILLCGGIGKRTELAGPKQFLMLNDIPVFLYSFNLFVKCNIIKSISLVCDSNYFHKAMDSINRFNASLLRSKHKRGFLHKGHSKNVLTSLEIQSEKDTIQALQFLKRNKYIIYDNEKGKFITNFDELLTDVMEQKRQHHRGGVKKQACRMSTNAQDVRGKGIHAGDEVKPSDIDSNRYKLIRLVENGPERVDSLLNALRGMDLGVQNGEYISHLLRGYFAGSGEAGVVSEVDGGQPARNARVSHILVHDGARPFLSELDLFNLIYMATIGNNAILGARATDTIKTTRSEQQGETDNCPRVKTNVDRQTIFMAQTPQIFNSQALLQVCEKLASATGMEVKEGSRVFTDTSSLFQHFTKKKVFALQGRFPNMKITTPTDVFLAVILMGHLFNSSHADVDIGLFKQTFVNSPSNYVPSNLFNDHFFYDSLGGKQRILYRHFYYE